MTFDCTVFNGKKLVEKKNSIFTCALIIHLRSANGLVCFALSNIQFFKI